MMDYVKSVIQEKMQVWMNIMIKYFTLPVSTASSPDAEKNWNCYAPIQDIFHKNPIYLKKLGSRNTEKEDKNVLKRWTKEEKGVW
jgi:hypothetical protein